MRNDRATAFSMRSEVRSYYGFSKDFCQAGYFETRQSQQIVKELAHEMGSGKLFAISGVVGCGKTTLLRHIRNTLAQDNKILVSQSLSVDKSQLTLPVLIDALFYDLETVNLQIPRRLEWRERALRDLLEKRQKPITLFIDDAHDVRTKTLTELKRLLEAVREEGGTLSTVLAGQPELKNVLRSPALEAIGAPAVIFDLEGFGDDAVRYLRWLLTECLDSRTKIETVLTEEAMVFIAGNSSTPLQFEAYLTRAFEEGYKVGRKPVTAEVIESVLAQDREPGCTRYPGSTTFHPLPSFPRIAIPVKRYTVYIILRRNIYM